MCDFGAITSSEFDLPPRFVVRTSELGTPPRAHWKKGGCRLINDWLVDQRISVYFNRASEHTTFPPCVLQAVKLPLTHGDSNRVYRHVGCARNGFLSLLTSQWISMAQQELRVSLWRHTRHTLLSLHIFFLFPKDWDGKMNTHHPQGRIGEPHAFPYQPSGSPACAR